MTEYIAYKGAAFTVEWYYDEAGKSQAFDYYNKMNQQQRIEFLKLAKRIGDTGKINNKEKFRSEGDKIFAFKPKPERFLCFFYKDGKIIVTNAFSKKQDKLPKTEKDRALHHMEDYVSRTKKGSYYDDKK